MKVELDLTVGQVNQMRHIMDNLPMGRYAPLILAVLPKLPLISKVDGRDMMYENGKFIPLESGAASPSSGADGVTRPVRQCTESGGFSLLAFTDKGKVALESVIRRLPHTGDL